MRGHIDRMNRPICIFQLFDRHVAPVSDFLYVLGATAIRQIQDIDDKLGTDLPLLHQWKG